MQTSQPETEFFSHYLLLGNILAAQEATSFRVPVVRLNLISQALLVMLQRKEASTTVHTEPICKQHVLKHQKSMCCGLRHLQVATCMYTVGADACGADSQSVPALVLHVRLVLP